MTIKPGINLILKKLYLTCVKFQVGRQRQRFPFPRADHHVTQPQRVVQPLKLLVLPVPLHQPLRHFAVLAFIILHHLEDISD